MVQIKTLDISRLRNDEDFGFQTRVVNAAVAMLTQEADKLIVATYQTALTAFDEALKQAAKNSQTAAVAAADAAYKQFVSIVNAFAIAFGEANYAGFINQVNVMIADIQAELKARRTRAENAKEEDKAKG